MSLYICAISINQLKYLVQGLHMIKMFPSRCWQHNLCVSVQSKSYTIIHYKNVLHCITGYIINNKNQFNILQKVN